jgi:uncharacterized protein (TIGR02246 family)
VSNKGLTAARPNHFDWRMKTYALVALLLLSFAAPLLALDPKIDKALRDLDDQWSKAAGAKNVDKTVSFYSEDAIVLPPNAPSLATKQAIRGMWKDFLASVSNISWKVTRVEAAKSGDMAYVSGTYETTAKDASGSTTNDRGKYLEVWEKQADGSWKCRADMFSSDLPAVAEKK